MFNQIHQVDSYLIWKKVFIKGCRPQWQSLTQELEAASSKVLVYLPDGGDCANKEECLARFPEEEKHIIILKSTHIALCAFFLCPVCTAGSSNGSTPSSFFSLLHPNPDHNRCSAGSDDQAHCTASRQELIEREGGIWGSNPEKNPFHDYFKVNLFESVCCTLKKTIEDTNPTLWYLGVRPFLFKWLLFWHKR